MAAEPDTVPSAPVAPTADKAVREPTILADGTPITASPNWDAALGVLIVHRDRDAGSNYDDVPVDPKAAGHAKRRVRPKAAHPQGVPSLDQLLTEVEKATGRR